MAEIMPERLTAYLDSLVPPRDPVMQEMEAYAREVRFPIIGAAAGYYLYQVARMIGAKQIFELGSGYGYSTAWFCRAVRENGGGAVHHVVWDEGLSQKARGYLGRLGYGDMVQFHVGEAVETLKQVGGTYDLCFNDIDKQGYPASIPVVKEHLRSGGILMIDNMIWHGAIFDEADRSPDTLGVLEVTKMLTTDPDFISTLIPIRDGVITAFRK
jgi:caffeoyl-CoA O-methyltransferase